MRRESVVLVSFLLLSLAAVPVYGAEVVGSATSGGTIQPNEFGTTGTTILNLGPCDLMPRNVPGAIPGAIVTSFLTVDNSFCESVGVLSGQTEVSLGAEVHLPSGAQITEITMYYSDTKTDTDPLATLRAVDTTGGLAASFDLPITATFFGNTSVTAAVPAQFSPVQNGAKTYHFIATLHRSATSQERIYRVAIKYLRQVTPLDPTTVSFPADVPQTHPFFQFIQALAASGISGGCGVGAYCPDQLITRGQMAVFLSTALGLHWPN